MALSEEEQQTLREWMQSKGIAACPACGRDALGVGAAENLLLPTYAAWWHAVPTAGATVSRAITSHNPYSVSRPGDNLVRVFTKLAADFNKMRHGFLKIGRLPSDGRRLVKVECGNCANVLLLNAEKVGLIGGPPREPGDQG